MFVLHVSLRRDQCKFPATPDPGLDEEHSKHHKRNSAGASQPACHLATSASDDARNTDMGAKFAATNTERSPTATTPEQWLFKFVASFRHFVKTILKTNLILLQIPFYLNIRKIATKTKKNSNK